MIVPAAYILLPATYILLAVIVIALYWPVIHGPFIYDDLILWVTNREMRDQLIDTGRHPIDYLFGRLYKDHRLRDWLTLKHYIALIHERPLLWSSYQLDARSGFDSTAFHWTNLALHTLAAITSFDLFMHWLTLPYAFIGALLFSVHPMSVMAVAYISGRSSLLCSVLMLGSLLAFVSHAYGLTIITGLLALMSKQEAIILPLLIGGLYWLR